VNVRLGVESKADQTISIVGSTNSPGRQQPADANQSGRPVSSCPALMGKAARLFLSASKRARPRLHSLIVARQAHHLALVNSVGTTVNTNDHHAGYYYNLTGTCPMPPC
jgi:hypothetical protein